MSHENGLALSVLDQSPVPAGSTPSQALDNSISLARHVDALGYRRFWMSEHHAMETLACTAPEILLARIGAETRNLRLGSGGIMLPHYTPLKVAETFRTLDALYPGRIDLGIGRAPGGGPIESAALRRNRTVQPADDFPEQVAELLAFLENGFPPSHPFSRIRVMPEAPTTPDVWMLGSSLWSADAAAQFGLPYAFAHFFSPVHTRRAIQQYRSSFLPSVRRLAPQATVAVGVICAETQEEAEFLGTSIRLLQIRIRQGDRSPIAAPADALRELRAWGEVSAQQALRQEEGEWPRYFVGTPGRVAEDLQAMAHDLEIDELVVNTIVWDHATRLRSYELLTEAFGVSAASFSPDRAAATR